MTVPGYIDEAEFASLMQRMSVTVAPIRKGMLTMVAELFQHEVDAGLSEPLHPHDYGLCRYAVVRLVAHLSPSKRVWTS
ncbi:MAG: hypothetical protein VR78_01235 [Hoeflea sp. BRH_c9]|nr:MAG: hypothetical protein VR78_01235 [Hoeflea sp. BRH_c9]